MLCLLLTSEQTRVVLYEDEVKASATGVMNETGFVGRENGVCLYRGLGESMVDLSNFEGPARGHSV